MHAPGARQPGRRAGRVVGDLPQHGPRHVVGHVAAADHHDLAADVQRLAQAPPPATDPRRRTPAARARPGSPRPRDAFAPTAMITAAYSRRSVGQRRCLGPRSRRSGSRRPAPRSPRLRGRSARAAGDRPARPAPACRPAPVRVSKTTGRKPIRARSWAADSPAGPAPDDGHPLAAGRLESARQVRPQQRRHLLGVGRDLRHMCLHGLQHFAVGRTSGPNCSQANRFRARIAIGRSWATNRPSASTRGTLPRRQAASHGRPQTRPQIDASGFGPRAIR